MSGKDGAGSPIGEGNRSGLEEAVGGRTGIKGRIAHGLTDTDVQIITLGFDGTPGAIRRFQNKEQLAILIGLLNPSLFFQKSVGICDSIRNGDYGNIAAQGGVFWHIQLDCTAIAQGIAVISGQGMFIDLRTVNGKRTRRVICFFSMIQQIGV